MRVIENIEKLKPYAAPEGSVNLYYGRIGSGKTYAATADILDLLDSGQRVVCNWPVHWSGSDDRGSFILVAFAFIFGRRLRQISHENLRFVPPEQLTADYVATLRDTHVFIDEAQNFIDSYKGTDTALKTRRIFQYARHMHVTINLISQRTQAIQVTARAQVNRFYRCERKPFRLWPRFVRKEYAEMSGEDVLETDESLVSEKHYWGSSYVFRAYNTHYLRKDDPFQLPLIRWWIMDWSDFRTFGGVAARRAASRASRSDATPDFLSPYHTDLGLPGEGPW